MMGRGTEMSDLKASLANALASADDAIKTGVALYFAVTALEMIEDNALTPAQRGLCIAHIDALRPHIPKAAIDLIELARRIET